MAILFDLDGTLLDTSQDIFTAVNMVLKQENLPPADYNIFRSAISFGSRAILAKILNLDPTNDPAAAQYIEKLFPRVLGLYAQTKFANTFAFPGIDDLLDSLERNNLVWGIVTNKNTALTKPLLQATGYWQRSACVVCGDTTPKSKPHPEPLFHACKLINTDPSKCVYIGDSVTDVQAGKAAGMQTVVAAFGFIPENVKVADWQADYVVQSATEIFPWIEEWSKGVA